MTRNDTLREPEPVSSLRVDVVMLAAAAAAAAAALAAADSSLDLRRRDLDRPRLSLTASFLLPSELATDFCDRDVALLAFRVDEELLLDADCREQFPETVLPASLVLPVSLGLCAELRGLTGTGVNKITSSSSSSSPPLSLSAAAALFCCGLLCCSELEAAFTAVPRLCRDDGDEGKCLESLRQFSELFDFVAAAAAGESSCRADDNLSLLALASAGRLCRVPTAPGERRCEEKSC